MSLERMLWMLDEIKQAIVHMEKARQYWMEEEKVRYGELMTLPEIRCAKCRKLVGGDGIEPSTSAVSSQRSASELTAQNRDKGEIRVEGSSRVFQQMEQPISLMSRSGCQSGIEEDQ